MSSVSDIKLIRTDLSFEMSLFRINLNYIIKSAKHVGLAPHKNISKKKHAKEENGNKCS